MIRVIIFLNILVMHVTKIIYSFFAKVDMLVTTICIIIIEAGMLGTIIWREIVMIKNNFSFH